MAGFGDLTSCPRQVQNVHRMKGYSFDNKPKPVLQRVAEQDRGARESV